MEDALDVPFHGVSSAAALNFGSEPIVIDDLVCGDDDIVALANANENPLSTVWNDWHEISSNDSQIVIVERKLPMIVDGCVDQAKSILLAWGQSGLEVLAPTIRVDHGAVEETVVSSGREREARKIRKGSLVVPVLDGHRPKIDIIVRGRRAIDDNTSLHAISVSGMRCKSRIIQMRLQTSAY